MSEFFIDKGNVADITNRLTVYSISDGIFIDLSICDQIVLISDFISCGFLRIDSILTLLMGGNDDFKDIPGGIGVAGAHRGGILIDSVPVGGVSRVKDLVESDLAQIITLCLDIGPVPVDQFIKFKCIDLISCRNRAVYSFADYKTDIRGDQLAASVRPHMTFGLTAGLDSIGQQTSVVLEVHGQEGSGSNDMTILCSRVAQRDLGCIGEVKDRR